MVFHYINKLRQRPETERKKIVLFAAGLLTGVIGLFWLATFNSGKLAEEGASEAISSSPFGDVKSSASVLFADFKSEWGALKEKFSKQEFTELLPADQGE